MKRLATNPDSRHDTSPDADVFRLGYDQDVLQFMTSPILVHMHYEDKRPLRYVIKSSPRIRQCNNHTKNPSMQHP